MKGYPVRFRTRAVQLVNDIGLKPTAASTVLEHEIGQRVNPRTIARWADPAKAERRLEQQRQARRRDYAAQHGGRLGSVAITPESKVARMRNLLDEVGLNAAQVARAMMFDFPDDRLDRAAVRRSVRTGEYAG
jgi:hypothetical protein